MFTGFKQRIQKSLNGIRQGRSIGKIGSVLLGIPAACLSIVLLGVSDVRQQEQQLEQSIREIERRVKMSEQVLRYVIDQETGVRGYFLTQDKQFLAPYHVAQKELFPTLTELKQQSSSHAGILLQLEQQIQQRLQQSVALLKLAEAIDAKDASSLLIRPNRILSDRDSDNLLQQLRQAKQTTDTIRQTVEVFKQEQQKLLIQKQEQLSKSKQFVDRVQILGALLSVLSYICVVVLFQALDQCMARQDQEIQQTHDTIQVLTNHLVDGVIILDQRGLVESLNPAAERILDRPSHSLVGQSITNVLFPMERDLDRGLESQPTTASSLTPHSVDAAAWVQERAATSAIEQLQVQQADSKIIPIELSVSPSASRLPKLIVLIRDVSERVQLTNALSEKLVELGKLNRQMFITNAALQRKNQSLETFVKAAAHDLKTPIRGVASLAQWLEVDLEDSLTAENKTFLRLLNQRMLRMQAIADGLLSYASIDAWVEQQAVIDTRVLVQEVCRQILVPAAFSVQIKGEMPTIRTPYLALQLVFEQLISNAIEHHDRDHGIIEIIVSSQEHCTEFIVRDDGPGIPSAYRERVLQMFQVLTQNPDSSNNIGVGLALVHKAIQLVGGTLDLKTAYKSDPKVGKDSDRGLEVCFTWPTTEPD